MKQSVFKLLILLAVIFQSCKKDEPIPDLASDLAGEFDIGYKIINMQSGEVFSAKAGESKYAKINLKRKDNTILDATIIIDDTNIKLTQQFEMRVLNNPDQTDTSGKPGLLKKYRVWVGQGIWDWKIYQDGSVISRFDHADDGKIMIITLGLQ